MDLRTDLLLCRRVSSLRNRCSQGGRRVPVLVGIGRRCPRDSGVFIRLSSWLAD